MRLFEQQVGDLPRGEIEEPEIGEGEKDADGYPAATPGDDVHSADEDIAALLVGGYHFVNPALRPGEGLQAGKLGEMGGAANKMGEQQFDAVGKGGGWVIFAGILTLLTTFITFLLCIGNKHIH